MLIIVIDRLHTNGITCYFSLIVPNYLTTDIRKCKKEFRRKAAKKKVKRN